MYRVVSKLKNVRAHLRRWNKIKVGDIFENAKAKRELLARTQTLFDNDPYDPAIQIKLRDDRAVVDEADLAEESLLRQKSRNLWLRVGDKNSKFFYSSLKVRRNRNSIKCLEADGQRIVDKDRIEEHVISFYKELVIGMLDLRKLIRTFFHS